jgi:hypothetical protein
LNSCRQGEKPVAPYKTTPDQRVYDYKIVKIPEVLPPGLGKLK